MVGYPLIGVPTHQGERSIFVYLLISRYLYNFNICWLQLVYRATCSKLHYMKTLLLIVFSLYSGSFGQYLHVNKNNEFSCTISSGLKTYKTGQTPDIKVAIVNKGKSDVYLIGALDGSENKGRMPYCYFSIEKPKPDTILYQSCGTVNPLRAEEYRLVKAGESFNPYAAIDSKGFWSSYMIADKETFKNPGVYRIQFHYSTNSTDIRRFLGSWDKNPDTTRLKLLFENLPKIGLSSNVLEINIVE